MQLHCNSQEERVHTQFYILYVSHHDVYYPYARAFYLLATYLLQETSKMIPIIKKKLDSGCFWNVVPVKALAWGPGWVVISYFPCQWHVVKSSTAMMYFLEDSALTSNWAKTPTLR